MKEVDDVFNSQKQAFRMEENLILISKKEARGFWPLIILPDLDTTFDILYIALCPDRGVLYHTLHSLCYDPKAGLWNLATPADSKPCEMTPAFHLNYKQTPLILDSGLLTSHGSTSLVLGPQTEVISDTSEVSV
jgi:hypothetical protein